MLQETQDYLHSFLKMFIYFWERERESTSRGRAGREREREWKYESEAGSSLWAVSTDSEVGLETMNREIMTWAEVISLSFLSQTPKFPEKSVTSLSVTEIPRLRCSHCRGTSSPIFPRISFQCQVECSWSVPWPLPQHLAHRCAVGIAEEWLPQQEQLLNVKNSNLFY